MRRTYYFYIDDVIFLFRDLCQKPPKQLFDHPFLAMLKDLHERYGMKVQLNCFGETVYSHGTPKPFTIDQTPDTYRDEWIANSDWLKLAFHARKEEPSYPYINASYEEMKEDYIFVRDEIIRFAGEETFTSTTNIHFLPASYAASRALVDCGVKILGTTVGEELPRDYDLTNLSKAMYERLMQNRTEESSWVYGKSYDFGREPLPDIKGYNHMTTAEHEVTRGEARLFYCEELGCYYVDFNSDGLILNSNSIPEIERILDLGISEKLIHIGIGTHEQYFYSGYRAYQCNYAEKTETAIKKMTENGYEPIFYEDYLPESRNHT